MAETEPPQTIIESSTRAEQRWREFKDTKNFKAWLGSRRNSPDKVAIARTDLFQALTEYIKAAGGVVVSRPGEKKLLAQIPERSTLPVKLQELGWHVFVLGTSMRTSNRGLLPVTTIEISK